MTNEQLYMLLRSMLAELEDAIEEARAFMPENAPKVVYSNLMGQEMTGDYVAISPFNDLWQTWNDRVELALGKDKTE